MIRAKWFNKQDGGKKSLKMATYKDFTENKRKRETFWNTFRKPRELLLKTSLKILQQSLAPWKQDTKKWGWLKTFCSAA